MYLAVTGIQNAITHYNGVVSLTTIFGDTIFVDIVLSLLSTLGLYLIASILFVSVTWLFLDLYSSCLQFEPWHMITSFLQYLLMSPSYINVLNVYAFSNVHDVSWGTKGDNKVSTDLGVVKTSGNKNEVEVEVPTHEKDINAAYQDAVQLLATKPPPDNKQPDAATKQEDYYRTFRTK